MTVFGVGSYIELAVLRTVVHRGAVERTAFGAEHRALRAWIVTQDLRIRRGLPSGIAVVLDAVFESDAVVATVKYVRFRDGDTVLIRPRQRYSQVLDGVDVVLSLGGSKRRQVCWVGLLAGSSESRLQQIYRCRIVFVLEPNGCRFALYLRVLEQVRLLNRPAQCADIDVEHVSVNVHDLGGGSGVSGRLSRRCWWRRSTRWSALIRSGSTRFSFGGLWNSAAQIPGGTGRLRSARSLRGGGGDRARLRAVVAHPRVVVQPHHERECDPEINTWVVSHVRDACRWRRCERKAPGRIPPDATDGSRPDVSPPTRSRGKHRIAESPAERNWSMRDRSGTSGPGEGSRSTDKRGSGMQRRGAL